jgi:hypothetical protein
MEQALGLQVVWGMFILRVAVPLAITLAVSYVLQRLNAHWHPLE